MNGTEIITFLSNNFPTVMTTVSAVVGGLFTAIFMRHNTSMNEFEKIKAGQLKEAADELLQSGKMTYTEYYKANNFLAVAKKADEYYSKMPHQDHFEEYDFDWFVRFYEAVGNISNEEMQDLWGKILAGEISHPSSFSLRTIDVLKNMSKADAELFEQICKHSVFAEDMYMLPRYDDYLTKAGIKYYDIMRLSELGLIYNDGTISQTVKASKELSTILTINNLIITQKSIDDNVKEFSIDEYPFTKVGYEIATLKNLCANEDEIQDFAREIKKRNPQVEIEVHRILSTEGNTIHFDKINLISDAADSAK